MCYRWSLRGRARDGSRHFAWMDEREKSKALQAQGFFEVVFLEELRIAEYL